MIIMASANLCLRCWHYKNGKCIANKGDYCRILKDMCDMTLKLVLKKQWYDMIASGKKKEEYRRISEYWASRLLELNEAEGYYEYRKFDKVTFYLGYSKNRPSMTFAIKEICMARGQVDWGAEVGEKYFVIRLGERL